MTQQQRHESLLEQMAATTDPREWVRLNHLNDLAVAEFYGLSLPELELNIEVCWQ